MDNDDTCVVVPVYNEATVVGSVIADLLTRFNRVVCVDDGSSDESAVVAEQAGAVVVRHPINLGQGAALATGLAWGLRHTPAAYFVTFDADGQHSVDDAVRMVGTARSTHVDVVLGSRFLAADAVPGGRRAILRLATAFTRVTTRLDLTDTHNGLRAMSRTFVEQLTLTIAGMGHASEFLAAISRGGWSYVEQPVSISYNDYTLAKGQSNLNAVNILFDLALKRLWAAS